jgi:hypothetical protein
MFKIFQLQTVSYNHALHLYVMNNADCKIVSRMTMGANNFSGFDVSFGRYTQLKTKKSFSRIYLICAMRGSAVQCCRGLTVFPWETPTFDLHWNQHHQTDGNQAQPTSQSTWVFTQPCLG